MFSLLILPLALLPSLIWLLFYLRKDIHPEPNRLIIRVFLWGLLVTMAMVLILGGDIIAQEVIRAKGNTGWAVAIHGCYQLIYRLYYNFLSFCAGTFLFKFVASSLFIIFFNAFWEETLKYLVVRFTILKNKEFDEPVDAMEYMIIVALAFAAVENLLIGFRQGNLIELGNVLFPRFLGATFIHALSSAVVGFFVARAIFHRKNRKRYPLSIGFILIGLLIASGLHGFFNFLIIRSDDLRKPIYLYLIAVFLLFLSLIVAKGFRRLNIQSLKQKKK